MNRVADSKSMQIAREDGAPAAQLNKRWLVASLLVVGLLALGVFLLSQATALSPAERFKRFAELVKDDLASRTNDPSQIDNFYRYDVVRTKSEISPYRASISFFIAATASEYRYDYLGGKWVCMAAHVRRRSAEENGASKTEVYMGRDLIEYTAAKILLRSGNI